MLGMDCVRDIISSRAPNNIFASHPYSGTLSSASLPTPSTSAPFSEFNETYPAVEHQAPRRHPYALQQGSFTATANMHSTPDHSNIAPHVDENIVPLPIKSKLCEELSVRYIEAQDLTKPRHKKSRMGFSHIGAFCDKFLAKAAQKDMDLSDQYLANLHAQSDRFSMMSGSTASLGDGEAPELDENRAHDFARHPLPKRQASTAPQGSDIEHQVHPEPSPSSSEDDSEHPVHKQHSSTSLVGNCSFVINSVSSPPQTPFQGTEATRQHSLRVDCRVIPLKCSSDGCTGAVFSIPIEPNECLTVAAKKLLDMARTPQWGCTGVKSWPTLP
ncbi:hypothetical protein BKA70DRAFT_1426103 [Coprinopsis sp. MPI-PUGE-AT-0042]|nr:hypothetical protein BKA70DRAFT_1426103 [Coprinopsis sp. MPI-PUGE-AT-0042]